LPGLLTARSAPESWAVEGTGGHAAFFSIFEKTIDGKFIVDGI